MVVQHDRTVSFHRLGSRYAGSGFADTAGVLAPALGQVVDLAALFVSLGEVAPAARVGLAVLVVAAALAPLVVVAALVVAAL